MAQYANATFDAELCAANPEAAAAKIAELEHTLACAGGLDRTRVIIIEDLRKRLSEALQYQAPPAALSAEREPKA